MRNKSAIILIMLAVGLFYSFTNVEYKKVKELHALAGEYQDVLSNTANIVSLRDSLLVAFEEFPAEEKTRVEKVLPDNIDAVKLALELDTMASKYGIAIKDVSVDTKMDNEPKLILPEHSAPYNKALVSFSFVSNYQNFKHFLADLERSLRIMEVKSLAFGSSETELSLHNLTVETYWLNE